MLKYYYQIVIDSLGQPYLDAEQQLLEQGKSAAAFLQEKLTSAAPFAKLIIQVILERIASDEIFQECLIYLDEIEQEMAPTIKQFPSPEGVANYLIQTYGERVASFLGLYLVKLGDEWPNWKTFSVLEYLSRLNSNLSADPLIRFIITTTNDYKRKFAVQALVDVGDASVRNKLEAELQLIETNQNALRLALEQIQVT